MFLSWCFIAAIEILGQHYLLILSLLATVFRYLGNAVGRTEGAGQQYWQQRVLLSEEIEYLSD